MSFADTLKVQGLYQVKTPLPFIPGTEVSGEILEADASNLKWRVGDRVVCIMTHSGGGWAEELVIDADRLLRMPTEMSFEEAACFPSAYGTSYYALKQRAGLLKDEVLLVLGAGGGVGLAAVSIGKAMGARVIAAASSDEKLDLARHHGADEAINYKTESLQAAVKRLTDGTGADVVYDPVGGALFEDAIRSVCFGGRVLVIGFASGEIPTVKINHILVKAYDLRGVRYDVWRDTQMHACMQNFNEMLRWYAEGKLSISVSKQFPLSQVTDGLSEIVGRTAVGKQVLIMK
jgi:NADPH2:quinone reductase